MHHEIELSSILSPCGVHGVIKKFCCTKIMQFVLNIDKKKSLSIAIFMFAAVCWMLFRIIDFIHEWYVYVNILLLIHFFLCTFFTQLYCIYSNIFEKITETTKLKEKTLSIHSIHYHQLLIKGEKLFLTFRTQHTQLVKSTQWGEKSKKSLLHNVNFIA